MTAISAVIQDLPSWASSTSRSPSGCSLDVVCTRWTMAFTLSALAAPAGRRPAGGTASVGAHQSVAPAHELGGHEPCRQSQCKGRHGLPLGKRGHVVEHLGYIG